MRAALSPHCSDEAFVDASVFQSPDAGIGTFRCPVEYPSFRDTGPIERFIVVFPRTAVWIRHDGSRAFLADPSIATIYNAAQRYERFPESPEGDRCDWFGVSGSLAREIVRTFDEAAADSDRPFKFAWAESASALYLRQRALLRRATAGELDALEGEEETIGIVEAVISSAYRSRTRQRSTRAAASKRHRSLVDAARAELLRTVRDTRPVSELARAIGASPYHLCRVFRARTGRTLHQHRMELRLRLALEHLEAAPRARNLSAIAHDLGFSSHAHLVSAMRRHVGVTPSAARRLVRTIPARSPDD